MGVGDSLDAPGTLDGPIPAGTWHLVGDAQILRACDVVYSFRHVRAGVFDEEIASFSHHFEPQANGGFDAVKYEEDQAVPAVDAKAGDLLVWRFSLPGPDGGGGSPSAYIPNGDGPLTRGRYPSITVPR